MYDLPMKAGASLDLRSDRLLQDKGQLLRCGDGLYLAGDFISDFFDNSGLPFGDIFPVFFLPFPELSPRFEEL